MLLFHLNIYCRTLHAELTESLVAFVSKGHLTNFNEKETKSLATNEQRIENVKNLRIYSSVPKVI